MIKQHFYKKIYAVRFFPLLTALFPVLAQNNKILFTGGNVKKTSFPWLCKTLLSQFFFAVLKNNSFLFFFLATCNCSYYEVGPSCVQAVFLLLQITVAELTLLS